MEDAAWCRNEIDRFILAKLEAGGQKPSPPADPRTLLRRLSYDLTGLPPSLEEVLAFTKEALTQWSKTALTTSAHVVSDGLWCFKAVTASGATHERTVTGGGGASVKLEKFRAVNTFLGNLKTAFSGTYHAFDFVKYAHRYLAEVQYRFNRRFDLKVIFSRLLRASAVTQPHPERVIRATEQCG